MDRTLRRLTAWGMLGLLAQFGPLGPSLFPECLGHSGPAGLMAQDGSGPDGHGAHGAHGAPSDTSPGALHQGHGSASGPSEPADDACCSGLCCCDFATGLPAQATFQPAAVEVAFSSSVPGPRHAQVSRLDHLGLPFATAPPA